MSKNHIKAALYSMLILSLSGCFQKDSGNPELPKCVDALTPTAELLRFTYQLFEISESDTDAALKMNLELTCQCYLDLAGTAPEIENYLNDPKNKEAIEKCSSDALDKTTAKFAPAS